QRAETAHRRARSAADPFNGGTHSALRRGDAGSRPPGEGAGVPTAAGMVPRLPAGPGPPRIALVGAGPRRAAAALALAWSSHEMPAPAHARRSGVPLPLRCALALARVPRRPLRPPRSRPVPQRALRERRIDVRSVRRQLELARPGLVSHEFSPHRVTAEVPPLLRRRLPR